VYWERLPKEIRFHPRNGGRGSDPVFWKEVKDKVQTHEGLGRDHSRDNRNGFALGKCGRSRKDQRPCLNKRGSDFLATAVMEKKFEEKSLDTGTQGRKTPKILKKEAKKRIQHNSGQRED